MVSTNHSRSAKSPASTPAQFGYVLEYEEEFLDLFPHRYDYLWAPHADPGERPDWQTESRHPLSDRLILQGSFLYGVRFGAKTNYLLLDIDRKSAYHPAKGKEAIAQIVAALEPLGLCSYVAVTSSFSDGIHLYLPFVWSQESWAIAQAAELLLQRAGFKIARGQLELFPNPRRDANSVYNGHRLPLQAGSFLLNSDFEPVFTSRQRFVELWRAAANRNPVGTDKVQAALTLQRRRYRYLGMSAQKFLNDLNAEIGAGWTGHGQSNHLIGRIAMREYIFHHAIHGGEPLRGCALVERIVEVAESTPGYWEWCRHQHEIWICAEYWARAAELSEYYPYKGKPLAMQLSEEQKLAWNIKQADDARGRIIAAVEDLKQQGAFPEGIRARLFALKAYGVGTSTLYKYKDLWQPEPAPGAMIHPVEQIQDDPRSLKPAPGAMIHPTGTISLYIGSEPTSQRSVAEIDSDVAVGGVEGGLSTAEGIAYIRSIVASIKQKSALSPPAPEAIPDENWFKQQSIWSQLAEEIDP